MCCVIVIVRMCVCVIYFFFNSSIFACVCMVSSKLVSIHHVIYSYRMNWLYKNVKWHFSVVAGFFLSSSFMRFILYVHLYDSLFFMWHTDSVCHLNLTIEISEHESFILKWKRQQTTADNHYHTHHTLLSKCSLFSIYVSLFIFIYSSESGTAFDDQSSSLIKLNNSTVLYLREVNKFLALVCILREYSFSRQGVIDFNFLCFREAIHKVFEIKKCATVNDELYDDDDDDDEDGHRGGVDDDDDDDDDQSIDYRRTRYESEDDIKLVNNQHFVRSSNVQNHWFQFSFRRLFFFFFDKL